MFFISVTAQIDPQKRDSLIRLIERQKKMIQTHQDSFTQRQDSLLNSKQTELNKNTKAVPGIHKVDNTENRSNTVLLPVALAIFLLIILIWKRKRDRKT